MDPKLQADLEAGRPVKVKPLAQAANRSPTTIRKAIEAGELRGTRLGRDYRVSADAAKRLLGLATAAA